MMKIFVSKAEGSVHGEAHRNYFEALVRFGKPLLLLDSPIIFERTTQESVIVFISIAD